MMDCDILTVDGLIEESLLFFDERQYDEAIEKLLDALKAITDKSTLIREQILIQSKLGSCYLELLRRNNSTSKVGKFAKCEANKYFSDAYAQLSQLSGETEKKDGRK